MQFRRRRIVVAVAAFLLAIGMLVLWPAQDPIHIIQPVPSASPGEAISPDDWHALPQRAVYIQSEPMAVRRSVADAAPESISMSADECTAGMAALALCPAEPERAQPAPQAGSPAEIGRPPAKDHATVRCNEAAVALGLCAQ